MDAAANDAVGVDVRDEDVVHMGIFGACTGHNWYQFPTPGNENNTNLVDALVGDEDVDVTVGGGDHIRTRTAFYMQAVVKRQSVNMAAVDVDESIVSTAP